MQFCDACNETKHIVIYDINMNVYYKIVLTKKEKHDFCLNKNLIFSFILHCVITVFLNNFKSCLIIQPACSDLHQFNSVEVEEDDPVRHVSQQTVCMFGQ